jgi:hypothetical protein
MATPHLPQTTSSTLTPAASTERDVLNGVVELVRSLTGIFPQLVDGNVDRKVMVREWALGLADFTPAEIAAGLAACRTRKFAPSLGEFAQLCRPWLDPEVAYLMAHKGATARANGKHGDWPHPAIFRAACTLDFEIRTRNYADFKRRWELELAQEIAAGWLEDVPPVPRRIEDTEGEPADPARVREILAKLRHSIHRDNQGASN